jgi:hypothetical protein
MARDDHELPKVLPRPAMPEHSMPCRWATPETAAGWAAFVHLLPLWAPHTVTPMYGTILLIFAFSPSFRLQCFLLFLPQVVPAEAKGDQCIFHPWR